MVARGRERGAPCQEGEDAPRFQQNPSTGCRCLKQGLGEQRPLSTDVLASQTVPHAVNCFEAWSWEKCRAAGPAALHNSLDVSTRAGHDEPDAPSAGSPVRAFELHGSGIRFSLVFRI